MSSEQKNEIYNFNHHYRDTLCRALGLAHLIAISPDPVLIEMLVKELETLDEKTKWLTTYVDQLSVKLSSQSNSNEVLQKSRNTVRKARKK